LNQDGAVNELEEDKSTVDEAAAALMRQVLLLSEWHDGEWQREEDCENLERDQLRECLIDITAVAEAQTEILDREPDYEACKVGKLFGVKLSCLHPVDLA